MIFMYPAKQQILTLRLLRGSSITQCVEGESRLIEANPIILSPIIRSLLIRSTPYSLNRTPNPVTSSELQQNSTMKSGYSNILLKRPPLRLTIEGLNS